MKKLITILFILFVVVSYGQDTKIIKGVKYQKMDERYYLINKKIYKDTYWLEGGGKDTNNDGKIDNFTRVCLMEKREDIV